MAMVPKRQQALVTTQFTDAHIRHHKPLLLWWINFDPTMDK